MSRTAFGCPAVVWFMLFLCLPTRAQETATLTATPTFEPIPVYNEPVPVSQLNSTAHDTRPYLTGDLLEIFFISRRNGNADIWSATRSFPEAPWNPPFPVSELNSDDVEWNPVVSADGLEIFYSSQLYLRPEDNFNWLFRSTRLDRSSPWSPPSHVLELDPLPLYGCFVHPTWLSEDGLRIYHDRTDGGDYDIYVAVRPSRGAPFSMPIPVMGVNSPYSEAHSTLSGDEKTMIFARETTQWDIYVAKRHSIDGEFVVVGQISELNAPLSGTQTGFVTSHLSQIWISSNRPGLPQPNSIYYADVFTPAPSPTSTAPPTPTQTPTVSATATLSTDVPSRLWQW